MIIRYNVITKNDWQPIDLELGVELESLGYDWSQIRCLCELVKLDLMSPNKNVHTPRAFTLTTRLMSITIRTGGVTKTETYTVKVL